MIVQYTLPVKFDDAEIKTAMCTEGLMVKIHEADGRYGETILSNDEAIELGSHLIAVVTKVRNDPPVLKDTR